MAKNSNADGAAEKKRRGQVRSRSGCITCRNRHVRCDEQRPICSNCHNLKLACVYSRPAVPLRDRRLEAKSQLLPGELVPWAAQEESKVFSFQIAQGAATDPFNVLPIRMPYKSRELFHHFYLSDLSTISILGKKDYDCVSLVTADDYALRSTVLIAGIHYSWQTGDLGAYQSAFLFHKVESIREINEWLRHPDPKSTMVLVKQICTLILAEGCLGNITAGEAHLEGLMALLNTAEERGFYFSDADDLDSELGNRYLLLTYTFLHGLKHRLRDVMCFGEKDLTSPAWDRIASQARDIFGKWHKTEQDGLLKRLEALRTIPYFFCPIPSTCRAEKIAGRLWIDPLRNMTTEIDWMRANPTAARQMAQFWNDGEPTTLFLNSIRTHVSSFSATAASESSKPAKETAEWDLPTSWVGVSASVTLYLHCALELMKADPMEPQLLRRLVLMVKHEVDLTVEEMRGRHGKLLQDFWFWKAFTGVLALRTNLFELGGEHPAWSTAAPPSANGLPSILEWLERRILTWCKVTGATNWSDSRAALAKIAWPSSMYAELEMFASSMFSSILCITTGISTIE